MGSMPLPSTQIFDVLIIGAGLSGICSLHHIRSRFPSWRVKVVEAGADVGGTWYWNRYPGCRVDTESLTYCFSFDKEMLREWEWKDTFSTQAEMHKYIRRVAEKHDMYKDVILNTRIKSAYWINEKKSWTFRDESGNEYVAKFCISCLGFLSTPTLPAIPGVSDFKGQAFHTSRWPANVDAKREFANKRIGVIGTGATGIQTITELSREVDVQSLTVFQRTANWTAPLRNQSLSHEDMETAKTQYDAIFQRCAETPTGSLYKSDPRKSSHVSDEERLALWEKLYREPGFGKWLSVFCDTYTDAHANELYSRFHAAKIRERVRDPAVAASLIPTTHGFGTRRVPLESGYFEAFNEPNVHLVDVRENPISRITGRGIEMADGRVHELDVLIFATGFDAITGAFHAIDWHAKDDRSLIASSDGDQGAHAIWADHQPRTFLGLMAPAMPNTFMILGPHQPYGNTVRSIEHMVDFTCDLLAHCEDNGHACVEPTAAAIDEWTRHVLECGKVGLLNEVDSWMTGVNKNVKGKSKRTVARYAGSAIVYRKRCQDVREAGYEGFMFS